MVMLDCINEEFFYQDVEKKFKLKGNIEVDLMFSLLMQQDLCFFFVGDIYV